MIVVIASGMAAAAARDDEVRGPWVSPHLSEPWEVIEMYSTPVYRYYVQQGWYLPPGMTKTQAMVWANHDAASSSSLDPPFSANKKISDDAGTGSQNEVSMDVDTNGNLYAGWNDNRQSNYACGYTRSNDEGATWSANELYFAGQTQAGDPVVVADKQGNLYRLCMGFSPSFVFDTSKSSDGGKTWTSWVSIAGWDKPWMAAHNGKLIVVGMNGGSIYQVRSTDDGKTWDTPKQVGGQQGACIVNDASGNLYLSWGLNTVQFVKSSDWGDSWSSPVTLGTGSSIHGSPRSASLTACDVSDDGKNVYVGWSRSAGGGDEVVVASSSDGGTTWGAAVKVNDGSSSSRAVLPWIAVDAAGTLHAAWLDNRNSVGDAYYSGSTDGGKTWIANKRVSDASPGKTWVTFIGDYTQLVVTPKGDVAYAFCENRDGTADIWFSKAPLGKGGGGGVARIEVTPPSASINADQTQQFAAKAFDVNGNQTNATFTWAATAGSTSAAGLYTPGPVGSFTVFANASGKSGTANITVSIGALSSISVTPPATNVPAGGSAQFSASGRDAKGNAMPVTVSWTASAGSIDQTGRLTAPTTVGSVTVTATNSSSGKSGTATANVVAGPVTKLEVAPPTATITADQTQQFTAQGFDQHGNPAPVTPVWSASGGTISGSGLYTPNKVGGFDVTAASNGTSARATVTVTPGALASIVLTPPGATITADETVKFTARGYDAKMNEVTISPAWSAGPSGTAAPDGTYTPDKAGTVTVKATQGIVSASATVTVRAGKAATVKVDPPSASITADDTAQFSASAKDARGNEIAGAAFDWSIDGAPDDGAVSPSGKFTPQKTGAWTVTATARGTTAEGEAKVTVTPGEVFEARIDPDQVTLKVDESVTFVAVGLDAKGNEVQAAEVAWKVENGVGTIDGTGAFKAKRAGSGGVTATVKQGTSSATATATVTVTPLDAGESVSKLFGGPTNALLFFVTLAAITAALVGLALWSRRKRKWRQAYEQASGPFGVGGGSQFAPYPGEMPSPFGPAPGGAPPPYTPPPSGPP